MSDDYNNILGGRYVDTYTQINAGVHPGDNQILADLKVTYYENCMRGSQSYGETGQGGYSSGGDLSLSGCLAILLFPVVLAGLAIAPSLFFLLIALWSYQTGRSIKRKITVFSLFSTGMLAISAMLFAAGLYYSLAPIGVESLAFFGARLPGDLDNAIGRLPFWTSMTVANSLVDPFIPRIGITSRLHGQIVLIYFAGITAGLATIFLLDLRFKRRSQAGKKPVGPLATCVTLLMTFVLLIVGVTANQQAIRDYVINHPDHVRYAYMAVKAVKGEPNDWPEGASEPLSMKKPEPQVAPTPERPKHQSQHKNRKTKRDHQRVGEME